MEKVIKKLGMGWLPDYPDFRDYTVETDQVSSRLKQLGQKDSVKTMLKKLKLPDPGAVTLPAVVDLRTFCSPIEDQEDLGSCTAHAGVGLVEYFELKAFGRYLDASRRFLYKVTRNLLGWTGDTGAYLRTTMGAMVGFGVCLEKYWPYTTAFPDWDAEPTGFCYAFGQYFQALSYYRLDVDSSGKSIPLDKLLASIKTHITAKAPAMFGFTVYSSISQAANSGKIPFPTQNEYVLGGHAIDAVGYDDNMKIQNTNPGGITTTGALIIRNSWGTAWGDKGYGYLPYEYVLKGLSKDWWCLLKNEWVDTKQFGF